MDIKKIKENHGSDNCPKGGRGKMHQLFGEGMTDIIEELNEILAA